MHVDCNSAGWLTGTQPSTQKGCLMIQINAHHKGSCFPNDQTTIGLVRNYGKLEVFVRIQIILKHSKPTIFLMLHFATPFGPQYIMGLE
jgi:hypothetical protein